MTHQDVAFILLGLVVVFNSVQTLFLRFRFDRMEENALKPIQDMFKTGEGWAKQQYNPDGPHLLTDAQLEQAVEMSRVSGDCCPVITGPGGRPYKGGDFIDTNLRDGPAGVKLYVGEPVPE